MSKMSKNVKKWQKNVKKMKKEKKSKKMSKKSKNVKEDASLYATRYLLIDIHLPGETESKDEESNDYYYNPSGKCKKNQ